MKQISLTAKRTLTVHEKNTIPHARCSLCLAPDLTIMPSPFPRPPQTEYMFRFAPLKMGTLRRKAEADIAEISQRLRQSEQRREELTDLKFAHEAELRELRGRSEAGEAGREAASIDAKALREANRALEARVFEAEREAERLRMQCSALTQQVRRPICLATLRPFVLVGYQELIEPPMTC